MENFSFVSVPVISGAGVGELQASESLSQLLLSPHIITSGHLFAVEEEAAFRGKALLR